MSQPEFVGSVVGSIVEDCRDNEMPMHRPAMQGGASERAHDMIYRTYANHVHKCEIQTNYDSNIQNIRNSCRKVHRKYRLYLLAD